MRSSFALTVQRLPRERDRVLVLGELTGNRNGDGLFTPGQVGHTFDALRIPRPGNISQALARLRVDGLVIRDRTGAGWGLTPEGRETLRTLVAGLDLTTAESELAGNPGAELFETVQPLIPPALAPARWAPAIARLLARHPFDQNVFCMTRYASTDRAGGDPIPEAVRTARYALARHGLTLHLASDRTADDELFGNVAGHMWACRYGIAFLETRVDAELNDNVLIEVGAMLMAGRRCALLKDHESPPLPSDFTGHIYIPVDITDSAALSAALDRWVTQDLGIARQAA